MSSTSNICESPTAGFDVSGVTVDARSTPSPKTANPVGLAVPVHPRVVGVEMVGADDPLLTRAAADHPVTLPRRLGPLQRGDHLPGGRRSAGHRPDPAVAVTPEVLVRLGKDLRLHRPDVTLVAS